MNSNLAWLGTLSAYIVAVFVAWAVGSSGSSKIDEIPLGWVCIGLAFAIQIAGFCVAWVKRSEKFFDALGSITFLAVTWLAIWLAHQVDTPRLMLAAMVSVWALRLGVFLSARIRRTETDRRFNQIRNDFSVFYMTWMMQGLWVTLSLAPALVIFTANYTISFDFYFLIGGILWVLGFGIECVADTQKNTFANDPENKGKFITTGLWSKSQHPNYFGEIMLWLGIAVISIPSLVSWQYFVLISPVFVYVLLVHISGIRMLNATAKRRWGEDLAYKAYTQSTPKLLIRPW